MRVDIARLHHPGKRGKQRDARMTIHYKESMIL